MLLLILLLVLEHVIVDLVIFQLLLLLIKLVLVDSFIVLISWINVGLEFIAVVFLICLIVIHLG